MLVTNFREALECAGIQWFSSVHTGVRWSPGQPFLWVRAGRKQGVGMAHTSM